MITLRRVDPAEDSHSGNDPHAHALALDIIALVKTYEKLSGKGASGLITKARKARSLDDLATLRDGLVSEISKARRKLWEKWITWGGLPLAIVLFELGYEVGFMHMPYLCDALFFASILVFGIWVVWMMTTEWWT